MSLSAIHHLFRPNPCSAVILHRSLLLLLHRISPHVLFLGLHCFSCRLLELVVQSILINIFTLHRRLATELPLSLATAHACSFSWSPSAPLRPSHLCTSSSFSSPAEPLVLHRLRKGLTSSIVSQLRPSCLAADHHRLMLFQLTIFGCVFLSW